MNDNGRLSATELLELNRDLSGSRAPADWPALTSGNPGEREGRGVWLE